MDAQQFLAEAKQLEEKIIADRRYLHTCPGTGFDIPETVAYVRQALTEMGYEPQDCGKAGLVALAGGKKPGKVFLIRADMDGLPIQEDTDLEFASKNGKMHACGHDFHTAMLLGAARLLKQHEDEIEGTVKLMFQPAEEIFEGAYDMIEAGVLTNPAVDAAFMLHAATTTPMPAGTLLINNPGVSASAADFFEINIQGKGCHGSMPEAGVDPITVAAHTILALQAIHARELSMYDQAVLTIGKINAGIANNVIPDTAVIAGSIRTLNEDTRNFIKTRLQEIAESTAKTFRAEATVTFGSGCPTLKNDADLSQSTAKYAKELLSPRGAFTFAELAALSGGSGGSSGGGSEDFAYISQQIPALMCMLCTGQPQNGYTFPQHHPKAKFDEDALHKGAAIYAYEAMRWLEEHK